MFPTVCDEFCPVCREAYVSFLLNICDGTFSKNSQHCQRQSHKMVKHTKIICRQEPTNFLSVFDHFVVLAFKGLTAFFYHKCFISIIGTSGLNL